MKLSLFYMMPIWRQGCVRSTLSAKRSPESHHLKLLAIAQNCRD